MKTMTLGRSPLEVSRIALGCMRLSDDRAQAVAAIQAALEQGITIFDHADIYGRGQREETFSAIWETSSGLRERVILQSKCGIRVAGEPDGAPTRYDLSCEHILRSVEGSLRRLKTDYLDVLLLHRPDALVEPEEVARAFDHLHQAGKVRYFGVSNHTTAQIQLLQTCVMQPLVANQVQLSVVHAQLINDGIVFNRDELGVMSRSEGTLEFCRMQGITLQAWGPLAGGSISGKATPDPDARLERAAALVSQLAKRLGVSQEAILVAWLLRHPARIQPVIGTTNPARIAATCQADEVTLSREEWYSLFEAGRGGRVP
ncbi:MAG: aldo/keto reductase [Anaerolineae bacterium]|nr:aldo/keto reductase [Anaerolineae bacterium]